MVNIWNLVIRTCPGDAPEKIFLKCPISEQPSLIVEILMEDLEFKKKNENNKTNPMRINVNIPEAKIYAYDLDFCVLVKFF